MTISFNHIIFIIGMLSPYSVHVIGELFIGDLLLLAVFLFILKKYGWKLKEPFPRKILFFLLLWFIGQGLTDIIRGSDMHDALRGAAAIAFLTVDFCAVYMMVRGDKRRAYILLIAFAMGHIAKFLIDPNIYAHDQPWKFGIGYPVIILSIILLSIMLHKRLISRYVVLCCLFFLGMMSIYFNARSMGGQVILAGIIFYYSQSRFFYLLFLRRISMGKLLLLSVLGLMLIGGILKTYQTVGESGILPENSQQKFDLNRQALSGPLGMLGFVLAGRHEFLASTQAVYDSPIIGHGSWAKDPKYRLFLLQINDILGTDRSEDQLKQGVEFSDLIPAHSHLMQAWVWAGILGAVFWLVVLRLVFQTLIKSLQNHHEMTLLVIFLSLILVWDILFSPFGGERRFQWAVFLSLFSLSIHMSKKVAIQSHLKRT